MWLALGSTTPTPLIAERDLPQTRRLQVDQARDRLLLPRHPQTTKAATSSFSRRPVLGSRANVAVRPGVRPPSMEAPMLQQKQKPAERRSKARPVELGILTYADKSLISEIQGYIQSKGRNRQYAETANNHRSPKTRIRTLSEATGPSPRLKYTDPLYFY